MWYDHCLLTPGSDGSIQTTAALLGRVDSNFLFTSLSNHRMLHRIKLSERVLVCPGSIIFGQRALRAIVVTGVLKQFASNVDSMVSSDSWKGGRQ